VTRIERGLRLDRPNLHALVLYVDKKSGQSNITSIRRVNQEIENSEDLNFWLGKEGKRVDS
jgi:hypothetical protein